VHRDSDITPPKIEFRTPTSPPISSPEKPTTPPTGVPRDPFGPPTEGEGHEIELAFPPPRKTSSMAPVLPEPQHEGEPAPSLAPPEPLPPRGPSLLSRATARIRDHARTRFVVALTFGFALGFAPAQIYASSSEDRLDEIRVELLREPPPPTDAAYELMLERYAAARARMVRTKARIEIATAIVWLVAGAGLSYGFWRFAPKAPR
jgi:hypothetical protein